MQDSKKISQFLSLVLRHRPEEIGLSLDLNGWADMEQLISCAGQAGVSLDRQMLMTLVQNSDKKRFALSEDQTRIRARQGHSIPVVLELLPQTPPPILYHGTATRFLASILAEGLSKMQRHHVHLSANPETALEVGARYGKPVLLTIAAQRMWPEHLFYQSENGVWLVEHVPAAYLVVSAGDSVTPGQRKPL